MNASIFLRKPGWCRSVFLGAVVLLLPAMALAQSLTGRFVTSAISWEKFDTVGVSHKVLRGFQTAIFDFTQNNVSLHTNMQAATTIGDNVDEDSDYRLYALYLKVKNLADVADVSVGRLPYFHGVGIGTVDGALVTARMPGNAYKLTLYGGASTPADYSVGGYGTLKDKFALGGQVVATPMHDLRASLSYMNRRQPMPAYYAVRVDQQTLDPITAFIVPDPEREQLGGVDAAYTLHDLSVYGRYDYDFELKKTQRAQVTARYTVQPDLILSLDATRREPHVPAGSFFSQFTLKGVTDVEAGVDYFLMPGVRAFVRGAYVAYDGDNSMRYSAGLGRNDVQLVVRGNTGYAGELTSVSLQGAYPLLDNKVTPNLGISYVTYRITKDAPRYNAFAGAFGATLRPVSALSLDLQGQWLHNQLVKSDFRFLGRLNFWFAEQLNIF